MALRLITLIFSFSSFVIIATAAEKRASTKKWTLVWSEEFDQGIREKYWSRCQRGKADWNNTMSNLPSLIEVRHGVLRLKGIRNPNQQEGEPPFLTAGLETRNKFTFHHGKILIRARFKSAKGAWPALWMLGSTGAWPSCGEIDLMEHLNFDHKVYQTVHSPHTLNKKNPNQPPKGGIAKIQRDKFNTYGCEWSADKILFTVNGQITHTYPRVPAKGSDQWPFNQPFFIILSMQIGGQWVGEPDPADYPAWLDVDFIRIYKPKKEISD